MPDIDPKLLSAKIGKRIRMLRAGRGLSIRQVSEATKMHRPLISRVELGTYMPRLDTLHRIAEALGVKVSEIVTAIDTIENSTEQPNE